MTKIFNKKETINFTDQARKEFKKGVREMSKYLLKKGLKQTSNQLKQLEFETAREVALKNYHSIKEKILLTELGEPGIKELQKIEKKYWKNKKQEFDEKQQPADKIKTTFKTKLSDTQLKTLFDSLKGEFIANDTNYSLFEAVFSEVDVNTLPGKINWLGANNLLAYFIDKMPIDKPDSRWNITEYCFTNSKNLRQAKDRYENSKTGKPKQANVIDTILKKGYTGLQ